MSESTCPPGSSQYAINRARPAEETHPQASTMHSILNNRNEAKSDKFNRFLKIFHKEGNRQDDYKLHPLVTPTTSHDVNIIAVHGLGGHPFDTWTYQDGTSKCFWLKDLIPTHIPNARIFTFGYDGRVANTRSTSGINDLVGLLLSAVQNNIKDSRKPIIFIGHSLGGIVCKKAFSKAKQDKDYRQVYEQTKAIMFMGTPHQGTAQASLGVMAAKIGKTTGMSVNSKLVRSLKKDSEMLDDIATSFRDCSEGLKIVSFYELESRWPFKDVVVNKNSAILRTNDEQPIPLQADHVTMVKFQGPNDPKFQQVIARLKDLKQKALQLPSIQITDENVEKFVKKFHCKNYKADLKDIEAKYCPGTCEWLLREDEYKSWASGGPGQKTLWIVGDAGCGKSTMAASLVSKVVALNHGPSTEYDRNASTSQLPSEPLVAYYFCKVTNNKHASAVELLSSILHQMLSHWNAFDKTIKSNIARGDAFFGSQPSDLLPAIRGILELVDNPKIYIIIDAIDELECTSRDPKEDVLAQLLDLGKSNALSTGLQIRILLTSRYSLPPLRHNQLSDPSIKRYELRRHAPAIRADIERYITKEVAIFESVYFQDSCSDTGRSQLAPETKNEMIECFVNHAQGIFLMATLAWTIFKDSEEEEAWSICAVNQQLKKVKNTPKTLPKTYEAILMQLRGKKYWPKVQRLLKWLVVSRVSLSVVEANWVLILDPNQRSLSSQKMLLPGLEPSKNLHRNCSLLSIGAATQTVQILHLSVQEYLLENEFTIEDANIACVLTCITYLGLDDYSTKNLHDLQHTAEAHRGFVDARSHPSNEKDEEHNDHCFLRTRPLLKYAALYWGDHAMECQTVLATQHWEQLKHWINKTHNIAFALRLFWYYNGTGRLPGNQMGLHVLCYFGLDELVSEFFSTADAQEHSSSEHHWTPVHMAAAGSHMTEFEASMNKGHVAVLKCLLRKDPKRHGMMLKAYRDGNTPLQLAAQAGSVRMTQMVLYVAGYDVDQDVDQADVEKTLILAAYAGKTDVVKLLLDKGANPNTWIEDYGSVLEVAALNEYEPIISLLLDEKYKANPNFKPGMNGGPLQAAALQGSLTIVSRLIEAGADIEFRGGFYATALQAAAFRGNLDVVELLVGRGADIDARGGQHGSAINAAAVSQQQEIVDFLMANGATRPTLEETSSNIDEGVKAAIDSIGVDAQWGRVGAVEKRLQKILQQFRVAITRKQGKRLDFLTDIGVQAFRVAVDLGRNNLLVFLTDRGMEFLETAVMCKYREGTRKIANKWAIALLWAVENKKAETARRMLHHCVQTHMGSVENGGDPEKAAALTNASIEILLAITKTENSELINIMTELILDSFDRLFEFYYRTSEAVMREFADRFQISGNSSWEELQNLGVTGLQTLQKALILKKTRLVISLTKIYWEPLQRIFNEEERLVVEMFRTALIYTTGETKLAEVTVDVGTRLLELEANKTDMHETTSSHNASNEANSSVQVSQSEGTPPSITFVASRGPLEPVAFEKLVGSTLAWMVRIARAGNCQKEFEILINYVARKQIARDSTQKGSLIKVFQSAKPKNPRTSEETYLDESIERMIADLDNDLGLPANYVKEQPEKKHRRLRHRDWREFLWCFGGDD